MVKFGWISSHIGVYGNNKADMAELQTLLQFGVEKFKITYTDLKCLIKFYTHSH